jgi:malonate-semialdehyde dehydrogenase (acetylating)/methylmalonate-semialdehyde dehydrogenase
MERITHHFGGRAWDGATERAGDVYNPATGEITGRVDLASPEVVARAVESARTAQQGWGESSLAERARLMFAFRHLADTNRDELARLITAEHGKLLDDARGEVARGLEVVDFACGIPHLSKGEHAENVSRGIDTYSIRQPLGVVAGVTPFNFPVMVPMWMFPIAIACGNTFVLKPSEKDPSPSLLIAELFEAAGFPPGVLNVVQGDKVAVDALLDHPGIAAVSSVGSTPVAAYIYERAAAKGKRVQALGGAKNHMVVLEDADMDGAADAAIGSAFGSAGERCMAISAVVAVGTAGDALIERVRDRLASLRVGSGDDPQAEMGPLVTRDHRDKVASYIETGVNEGADLVVDGRDLKTGATNEGFYLGPSLFDRVTPAMTIYKDEIFGPVLSVVRVETLDDAIATVNSNAYGNGTAIFTTSGGAARRFQHEVEVGMVGVNVPIPVPMAFFSFGGWKASLFGDMHMHGPEGVRFYTRLKTITARWPGTPSPGASLNFPTT